MSKAERLIYLRAQWQQLNALAGQMAASIKCNGGRMTQTEMAQARNLLDMMSAVEAEGQMTSNALANEARQELIKMLFKGENLYTKACGPLRRHHLRLFSRFSFDWRHDDFDYQNCRAAQLHAL